MTVGRTTELGPVEYVIVDFPGNRFDGTIAPAIADLVDRDLVRILDLVFVKKDADGAVTTFEYDDLDEVGAFADIDGDADGLMSDDDVTELATTIPPDSSALFILWEDKWARALGQAVRAAGGELIAGGRIPHAVVDQALARIEDDEEHRG